MYYEAILNKDLKNGCLYVYCLQQNQIDIFKNLIIAGRLLHVLIDSSIEA